MSISILIRYRDKDGIQTIHKSVLKEKNPTYFCPFGVELTQKTNHLFFDLALLQYYTCQCDNLKRKEFDIVFRFINLKIKQFENVHFEMKNYIHQNRNQINQSFLPVIKLLEYFSPNLSAIDFLF